MICFNYTFGSSFTKPRSSWKHYTFAGHWKRMAQIKISIRTQYPIFTRGSAIAIPSSLPSPLSNYLLHFLRHDIAVSLLQRLLHWNKHMLLGLFRWPASHVDSGERGAKPWKLWVSNVEHCGLGRWIMEVHPSTQASI